MHCTFCSVCSACSAYVFIAGFYPPYGSLSPPPLLWLGMTILCRDKNRSEGSVWMGVKRVKQKSVGFDKLYTLYKLFWFLYVLYMLWLCSVWLYSCFRLCSFAPTLLILSLSGYPSHCSCSTSAHSACFPCFGYPLVCSYMSLICYPLVLVCSCPILCLSAPICSYYRFAHVL